MYVALSDDNIDRRIAEFINSTNDPHRLTKLFIREREGVYQFGSKRVYVKMEGDKVFSKQTNSLQSESVVVSSTSRSS